MTKNTDVFVGIKDVNEIRRNILATSKETLHILQSHEQYKHLRTQKLQQTVKLYKILAEITALNKKIKTMLPKIAIEEQGPSETSIETADQTILKPAKTKIDLLEEELDVIEQRLSALS